MSTRRDASWKFGVFRFDTTTGSLTRSGQRIALAPQPARVLGCLLEGAGRMVGYEELAASIWEAGTYVDARAGLHSAVREIRQALHDDAVGARFVETVPRKGYRFVAPVEPALDEPRQPPTRSPASRQLGMALTATVLIAVIAGWKLAPGKAAGPSAAVPSAAVDTTQRAEFVLAQEDRDAGRRAFELFERALRVDGQHVPALVGRARSRLRMTGGIGESWPEALATAEREMQQALALDPDSAAAWALTARVRWLLHRDGPAAEKAFARSMELDPDNPEMVREWARFLASQQRHAEAMQVMRQVRERNPDFVSPSVAEAWIFFYARRYEAAIAEGLRSLELAPDEFAIHHLLATAFSALGNSEQANQHFARMRELSRGKTAPLERSDGWWLLGPEQGGPAIPEYAKALVVLANGDEERAYGFLERSLRTHENASAMLAVDPRLDPLRPQPRFQALLRQVNSARRAG